MSLSVPAPLPRGMVPNASNFSRIVVMNISHVMCCRNDEGVIAR